MNTIQKLFKALGPHRLHILGPFELFQFILGKEKKILQSWHYIVVKFQGYGSYNHFVCYPGFSAVSFSCGFVLVLLISTSPREWAGAGKEIQNSNQTILSVSLSTSWIYWEPRGAEALLVALIKGLVGEEVRTNGNIEIFWIIKDGIDLGPPHLLVQIIKSGAKKN